MNQIKLDCLAHVPIITSIIRCTAVRKVLIEWRKALIVGLLQ